MSDHSHRSPRFSSPRWQWVSAFIFIVVAGLIAFAISSADNSRAFVSSEVHFTDAAPDGLLIVPASCPSYPFDAESPYGCSGPITLCLNGDPAPNGDVSQCTCAEGNTSQCVVATCLDGSLAPNDDVAQCTCAQGNAAQCLGNPTGGPGPGGGNCASDKLSEGGTCVARCDLGYVQEGSACVFQSCPVGYLLQGNFCVMSSCPLGERVENGSCVANQCSPGYVCGADNSSLYYEDGSCTQSLVQTCAYGCSVGACSSAPASSATISASPPLLQEGETTQVSWSAQNVVAGSCTVSGSNGDTWSGANGTKTSAAIESQTIYTLSCTGLDGSQLSKQVTVNVVPVFNEH